MSHHGREGNEVSCNCSEASFLSDDEQKVLSKYREKKFKRWTADAPKRKKQEIRNEIARLKVLLKGGAE